MSDVSVTYKGWTVEVDGFETNTEAMMLAETLARLIGDVGPEEVMSVLRKGGGTNEQP